MRYHPVAMCPFCGFLFVCGDSSQTPAHTGGESYTPARLFTDRKTYEAPTPMCAGSFDARRNPWLDKRPLLNGNDPPSREVVEAFQKRQGKK